MIKINPTKRLSEREKEGVFKLWNQEYPANIRHTCMEDFDLYLSSLTDTSHLLLTEDGIVLGWAFKFQRDQDPWFAIILDHKIHGRGLGSALLEELKMEEEVLNGWVVDHNDYLKTNGKPYQSPLGFYLKNDFSVLSDSRSDTPLISTVQIRWTYKLL